MRRLLLALILVLLCAYARPGSASAQYSCPDVGGVGWKAANDTFTISTTNFGTITATDLDAGYKDLDITTTFTSNHTHNYTACIEATAANMGSYPHGGTKPISDLTWRIISVNGVTQPDNGFTAITQSWIHAGSCTNCNTPQFVIRLRLLLSWAKDEPNLNGTSLTYTAPISIMIGDRDYTKWP